MSEDVPIRDHPPKKNDSISRFRKFPRTCLPVCIQASAPSSERCNHDRSKGVSQVMLYSDKCVVGQHNNVVYLFLNLNQVFVIVTRAMKVP